MFSLRASSPFGGYREKYTRERHARGDATAPRGFAARSRVLARLPSLPGHVVSSLRGTRKKGREKRRAEVII